MAKRQDSDSNAVPENTENIRGIGSDDDEFDDDDLDDEMDDDEADEEENEGSF